MRIPGGGLSSSSSSSSVIMRHEFLRRWVKGLEIYCGRKKEMGILERKKAIKLSADVAMASTRIGTKYCWSRALMAKASKDATGNKILVEHINNYLRLLPDDKHDKNKIKKIMCCKRKMISRNKKLLRKKRSATAAVSSIVIAKNLVKKRTQLLKSLVPGGEFMDDVCLIRETLDYIVSLRLQVEIMRRLASATLQLEHEKQK